MKLTHWKDNFKDSTRHFLHELTLQPKNSKKIKVMMLRNKTD